MFRTLLLASFALAAVLPRTARAARPLEVPQPRETRGGAASPVPVREHTVSPAGREKTWGVHLNPGGIDVSYKKMEAARQDADREMQGGTEEVLGDR